MTWQDVCWTIVGAAAFLAVFGGLAYCLGDPHGSSDADGDEGEHSFSHSGSETEGGGGDDT